MNSGLPPAARAIRSRSSSETASPISASACSAGSGSSRSVPGQLGTPLDELRARHAHEQKRGASREQRRRLDEIEERLLAPLDVVEDDDQRRLLLEQLAERPGDLVSARCDVRLTEQRADRRRRHGIRRERRELLHHLHHRPVRDSLAVGQAAAADDASLDRGERLRHEPRLADSRVADDRHELAARLLLRALPRLGDLRELALATDEPRSMAALRRVEHRDEPERRHRLRLPFQRRAARPARPRPRRGRARSVASPISTSPGSAACSNRAATLTASPVASRSDVPVTTSPVFTPIRPRIPSSGSASRISTAARHARSASSSCAAGCRTPPSPRRR